MKIFNSISKQWLMSLCLMFMTAQANASVCFLPDATNCGTDSIINQCDGVRFFGKGECSKRLGEYHKMKGEDEQDRLTYMTCSSAGDVCDELKCIWSSESACRNNADSSSSPDYHYECYWDADNGCWYQTKTRCYTYDDPNSNPSYTYDNPVDNMACKSNTWDLTHHKCTEKGIAYTEPGTRTTYDCVEIKTDVRGCSGYNLDAKLPDYDCQSCEKDVYKTDYYGNYNYSGKGNTVYSCSKTAGCSGYDLTASQKATKEASGDYRCHECTPTVTDSDGNTSTGTTVYKCGKITTSTNGCSEYTVSQADKATKESQGYSCEPCTPTTTYYEDGVEYDSKSSPTMYKCGSICDVHTKKSTDCKGNTNFVSAGANFPGTSTPCGDCVNCADENNLPTTSACYGLHLCDGGREPEGETPCYCGKYKYFKKCMVTETCRRDGDSIYENGGKCYNSDWTNVGYYTTTKEKCTKADGSKIYYVADCTEINCLGQKGPAYGLKRCEAGAGVGTPVECGGYKWYTECGCARDGDSIYENGGRCWNSDWTNIGYYTTTKEKCTKADGSKIYYVADCTGINCLGQKGPAYGLKQCASDEKATGTAVKCGGYEYGTSCVKKVECSYDHDEDMCKKAGKTFVKKCHDNNNKWWGECQ